jgi:pyruvate dehydrogenase E1 component alpha subunit
MDGHAVHDPADYVPADLLEEWRTRDPIERLTMTLTRDGVERTTIDTMRERAKDEMDAAAEQAETAELPDAEQLLDGVYAEIG